MPDDINLLPEDLHNREEKAEQEAAKSGTNKSTDFSNAPEKKQDLNVIPDVSVETPILSEPASEAPLPENTILNTDIAPESNTKVESSEIVTPTEEVDVLSGFPVEDSKTLPEKENKPGFFAKLFKKNGNDKKKPNETSEENADVLSGFNFSDQVGGLDVNLAPEGVNARSSKFVYTMLGLTILGAMILVGAGYYLMDREQKLTIAKHESLEAEIDLYRNRVKEASVDLVGRDKFRNDLIDVQMLLDSHVYWTEYIERFEKWILPNVHVNSFQFSTASNITLEVTAKDPDNIIRQNLILDKIPVDLSTNATMSNISRIDGLDFWRGSIMVTLQPGLRFKVPANRVSDIQESSN